MSSTIVSSAICIVLEQRPFWGPRLRQQLSPHDIPVRQSGDVADCWGHLRCYPSSLLAVAADGVGPQYVIGLADRVGRMFPNARVVAMVGPGKEELVWLLREAGAIHIVRSIRDLHVAVALARRHVARAAPAALSAAERVRRTLPWRA